MTVTTNLQQLYETDDHLWLLQTIEFLKQNRFDELDLENLIEELKDLDNEKKNAVERGASQFGKNMKERRNNLRLCLGN